jgi:CHAT domain-containing protein
VELRDGVVTLADLKGVETHLRLAFVNACEAARVRGRRKQNPAASFAEYFLRSGIEAFLGTYWPVGDTAAKEFATTVYQELANGKTLDEAVRLGRQALLKINSPEWANYLLYGGGNFRLSSQ